MQNPVLEALQAHTTIAWSRASNLDPSQPPPVPPPQIEWVFASPSSALKAGVDAALASFRGRVAWEFGVIDGRWYLKPARVREVQERQPIPLAAVACEKIAKEEPGFVAEALADVADIAEHISRCLSNDDSSHD